ncbi:MAG: hypothetical protein ACREMR_02405, partial [Gemmatimonadales bacterium]
MGPLQPIKAAPGGATSGCHSHLWKTTAPDPDGAGSAAARVDEAVYDITGRVVASRIGTEPWSCTFYDHRGRVTSTAVPAFDGAPARTITSNYSVYDPALAKNNPALTSVSDAAGTITTKVDWIGPIVGYTDVWGNTTTTAYDQAGRVTDT